MKSLSVDLNVKDWSLILDNIKTLHKEGHPQCSPALIFLANLLGPELVLMGVRPLVEE